MRRHSLTNFQKILQMRKQAQGRKTMKSDSGLERTFLLLSGITNTLRTFLSSCGAAVAGILSVMGSSLPPVSLSVESNLFPKGFLV